MCEAAMSGGMRKDPTMADIIVEFMLDRFIKCDLVATDIELW